MAKKLQTLLKHDRRRTERISFLFKVFFSEGKKKKWEGPAPLKDLSGGGIQFVSSEQLPKDMAIKIKIQSDYLPEPVILNAVVVRSTLLPSEHKENNFSYRTAAHFIKSPSATRSKFVSLIFDNILSSFLNPDAQFKSFNTQ